MALGFGNAIFGPASYSQPIILDDVLCVGNETQLLDCPRSDIGVHNCQHLQDASVDCLGRSPGGCGYICRESEKGIVKERGEREREGRVRGGVGRGGRGTGRNY